MYACPKYAKVLCWENGVASTHVTSGVKVIMQLGQVAWARFKEAFFNMCMALGQFLSVQ
jgi:hypothetical protein